MNKILTKNGIIDACLLREEVTEHIIEKVLRSFPTSNLPNLKRQIYSRRNVIKDRKLVTA